VKALIDASGKAPEGRQVNDEDLRGGESHFFPKDYLRDEWLRIRGKDTAKLKFDSQPPTVYDWRDCKVPARRTSPEKLRNGC